MAAPSPSPTFGQRRGRHQRAHVKEGDESSEDDENTQYFEGLKDQLLEGGSQSQAQNPEAAESHQANPLRVKTVKTVEKTNDGNNINENRTTERRNSNIEASGTNLNDDKKSIPTAAFQPSRSQLTQTQSLVSDTRFAALCGSTQFASGFVGGFETQSGTQGGETQFVKKLREELLDSDDDKVEDSQPVKPVSRTSIESTKDIGPKRGTFTASRPHIGIARRAVVEGHILKLRSGELRLLGSSGVTGVLDGRENSAVGHASKFSREHQKPNPKHNQQSNGAERRIERSGDGRKIFDESILLQGESQIFGALRSQLLDDSQSASQSQLWKGTSGGKSVFAPGETYQFVQNTPSQQQQESVESNSSGFVDLFGAGRSSDASLGKRAVGDEWSPAANKSSADLALPFEQWRQSPSFDRRQHHHGEFHEPENATVTPENIFSIAGNSSSPSVFATRAPSPPKKKERIGSISEQIVENFELPLLTSKTKTMDDYSIPPQGSGTQTQENSLTYTPTRLQAALLTSPTQASIQTQTQITQTQAKTIGMATKWDEASASTLPLPTQTPSQDGTYEEDESGAVHLSLGLRVGVQTSPFGVSQDAGYQNLQLNAGEDEEPETPAPPSNPFDGEKSKLMGASQLFGATQSSPVDARLLESGGPRPSPGNGMDMGGMGMMAEFSPSVQRRAQVSSPALFSTDVGSSFQPFDLSTQPHANHGRNSRHIPPSPIFAINSFKQIIVGEEARAEDNYTDFPAEPAPAVKHDKTTEAAKRKSKSVVQEESEDEFDREERVANEKRAKLKRSKADAEAQLKAAGDAMTANAAKKAKEHRANLSRGRSYRKSVEPNARSRRSEEVEVPASGEARKSPAVGEVPARKAKLDVEVLGSAEPSATAKSSKSSEEKMRSRTAEEEYVAQSLDTEARDKEGADATLAISQVVPSSQPEVVVDSQHGPSQHNISTQGDSILGSNADKVTDSFPDAKSKGRSQVKLNPKSSMVFRTLHDSDEEEDQVAEEDATKVERRRAAREKISFSVTSCGHDLKTATANISSPKSGPSLVSSCNADKADGAAAGQGNVGGDDEVVPETSPAKPFAYDDVMRDTSPMMSFSEMRMSQDGPETLEMENLGDITPTRVTSRKTEKEKPAKQDTSKRVNPVKIAKQMEGLKRMQGMLKRPRSTKVLFTKEGTESEAERVKWKTKDAEKENKKAPALVSELPPEPVPARPARRCTRRQPADVAKLRAARPTRKPKNSSNFATNSNNKSAPPYQSAVTTHKKKVKPAPAPAQVVPSDDAPVMFDGSVSPIRQSVEQPASSEAEIYKTTSFSPNSQNLPCAKYSAGKVCNKEHEDGGYYPDENILFLVMKRKSSAVSSTASPDQPEGARKEKTTSNTPTSDASRETSVFGGQASEMSRLPPTATQGRNAAASFSPPPTTLPISTAAPTNITGASTQYKTTREGIVLSSPLSDVDYEMIECLHTAQAEVLCARSRSGTVTSEISDAPMMLPPTVTRKLNFAAPPPAAAAVAVAKAPAAMKGKGAAKRSASAASIGSGSDTSTVGRSKAKPKKAAKNTMTDTPSRPRRSASATSETSTASGASEDVEVVRDTPARASRSGTSRPGRQARNGRLSYQEPDSDEEWTASQMVAVNYGQHNTTMDPKHKIERGKDKAQGDLFRGMAFAVSYREVGNEAVRNRLEIEKLIKDHGGRLIDSFTELFTASSASTLGTPNVSRSSSTNTSFASTTGRRSSAQPQPQLGVGLGGGEEGLRLAPAAEKLGFVAFVGDHYTRKSKFIQALALSLPCLSSAWIRSCVRSNRIVPWHLYLLPAGESKKLGGAIRSRQLTSYSATKARFRDIFDERQKMLEGMGVLFLMGKKDKDSLREEKKKQYFWLTRALGAREARRVKDITEAKALVDLSLDGSPGWDLVYVDDKSTIVEVKEELLGGEDAAKDVDRPMTGAGADAGTQPTEPKPKRKVRVVSDEFVVQSLILGCLEDNDGVEAGEEGEE